jgi:hypothetical protein
MTSSDPNPFEVLRLDPATPTDEIVRAAARLRQRATDESTVAAIRQAVQALTGPADQRRLYELLTHPSPRYDWPAVEEFAAAFWRSPCPDEATSQMTDTEALLSDPGA